MAWRPNNCLGHCATGSQRTRSLSDFLRRTNGALLQSGFEQGLAMAAQMRVLKVGQVTLAIDGAKILANASNHSAVSHGHATEQIERLEKQVAELLAKAEAPDSAPLEDGLTLPEEIARRQERLEQLRAANEVACRRAQAPLACGATALVRLFFRGFAGFFPANDALGVVLHVAVAEGLSGHCALRVGRAVFIRAIGDDERAFVHRQLGREFGLGGREVNRAGNVARLVGTAAIHVDERDVPFRDGRLQLVVRDVGELLGGKSGDSEREAEDEVEE